MIWGGKCCKNQRWGVRLIALIAVRLVMFPHPAIVSSQLAAKPSIAHPAQRVSRQRFRALAQRVHNPSRCSQKRQTLCSVETIMPCVICVAQPQSRDEVARAAL